MVSLLALTAGLFLAQADDAAKKELDKIQGKWVATVYEVNGMPLPEEVVKTIYFVCTEDKYVQWMNGMEVEKGKHKLDPAKKPHLMDITITDGDAKGETQLAIYEVDGDTFKMCASFPGSKDRPKDFTSKPGSETINIVLKREKKDK